MIKNNTLEGGILHHSRKYETVPCSSVFLTLLGGCSVSDSESFSSASGEIGLLFLIRLQGMKTLLNINTNFST